VSIFFRDIFNMWILSSHGYSLARGYRFRDPKMEQLFLQSLNKRALYITQFNYAHNCLAYSLSCLSYWGSPSLKLDFWVCVAIVLASLFYFINGFVNPLFQRHRILADYVYGTLFVLSSCSLLVTQREDWMAGVSQRLIPAGSHLFLQEADGTLKDQGTTVLGIIWVFLGRVQYNAVIALMNAPSFQLSFHGLRGWIFVWGVWKAVALVLTGLYAEIQLGDCIMYQVFSTIWLLVLAWLFERDLREKYIAEMLLAKQMHASTTADSILNHMLKNTLSDAVGCIELFLAGCASEDTLRDGVLCLRRGMRACKERQVYLKLVAGEYVPVQNLVNLKTFGEQLVAGRTVRCELPDVEVLMDSALIALIVDNALSNAFKHGRSPHADVALSIHVDTNLTTGLEEVEFVVGNAADPQRPPLTPEAVARLLTGNPSPQGLRRTTALSDGIGLAHCLLAAEVAGCSVSLAQVEDRVEFRVLLAVPPSRDSTAIAAETLQGSAPGRRASGNGFDTIADDDSSTVADVSVTSPHALPMRIRVFLLDDSAASRRILEHQIRAHCPTAHVTSFGQTEGDIELFTARAIDEADVVIVDQHLEYTESYLGTNLVQRMILMGYRGLVCIRSGDDGEADRAHYAECGAHCFLGKDLPAAELVRTLISAYCSLGT